jgi:Big-like domain-containing protein
MLRSSYLALAACAFSVVLSACGSDSDDDELVAGNIQLTATEDTPVRASLAFGGGTTATVVTAPTKGDVTFSGSPLVLTYTPRPNENGVDSFTYQVSDGDKTSNLGSVVVGINAVDDQPVIQATLEVDEDSTVTATLITDLDGDPFTSKIATPPSHGTLTVDSTNPGKFTYIPNADFNGADSVGLSVDQEFTDGTVKTVTGTVAITVRPANDPPAGVADTVRTVQGLAARFEPLANDRDIDGDTLAVSITSAPAGGSATVNDDGSIQYTPSPSFVGNTSLEYEVRDAGGLTARATMSIDVGLTSGILYLSRPDTYTPNELYFSDGARNFKVNAPLADGESIYSAAAAKSAPIVFYQTQQNGSLYRVDLRQPGIAQQVDPTAPDTVQELQGIDLNALASSSASQGKPTATANLLALNPQVVKQFGGSATMGPQADDGSFAVVVARDLHVVNLRDTSQLIDITSGVIAEKPTLIPNF